MVIGDFKIKIIINLNAIIISSQLKEFINIIKINNNNKNKLLKINSGLFFGHPEVNILIL